MANKKEAKVSKNFQKLKKDASALPMKSGVDVARERQKIEQFVDQNIEQLYKSATKLEKNVDKLDNIFVSSAGQLEKEFNQLITNNKNYKLVSKWYRQWVTRYNFDQLLLDSLNCLVKKLAPEDVQKTFEEVQNAIDQGQAAASTARAVAKDSLSMADELLGIGVGATKAGAKIVKNYVDLKSQLRRRKIKTINDARINRYRKDLLNSILPTILVVAAKTLTIIVQNLCDEDEVGVFNLADIPGMEEELRSRFGIDPSTLDDFIALLGDLSSFLTKIEICNLFSGEPPENVLDSVSYYIDAFYPNIGLLLDRENGIREFFIFLGNVLPDKEEFCLDVEINAIGDERCLDFSTYSGRLRKCIQEKNKKQLLSLKESYIKDKNDQLKDVLEKVFFPKEMRIDQVSLQKSLQMAEQRRKLKKLTNTVDFYKEYYKINVENLKDFYTAEFNFKENSKLMINDLFNSIKIDVGDQAKKDRMKQQLDQIKKQITTSLPEITKVSKQILPDYEQSLILSDGEIRFDPKDKKVKISKFYTNLYQSKRQLERLAEVLSAFSSIDENNENIFANPLLYVPYSNKNVELSFNPESKSRSNNLKIEESKGFFYIGIDEKPNIVNDIHKYDLNIQQKDESNFEDKLSLFKKFGDNIKSEKFATSAIIAGSAGEKVLTNRYLDELKTTYNQLAKVCYNSFYSKKIPVGEEREFDADSVSGYTLAPPYYFYDENSFCGNVFKSSPKQQELVDFNKEAIDVTKIDVFDFARFRTQGSIDDELVDEDEERERYLNLLIKFKLYVTSFVLKSLPLFSEFDFEEEEVDDVIRDYVFLGFYRKLLHEDSNNEETSLDYQLLSSNERGRFLDTVRFDENRPDNDQIKNKFSNVLAAASKLRDKKTKVWREYFSDRYPLDVLDFFKQEGLITNERIEFFKYDNDTKIQYAYDGEEIQISFENLSREDLLSLNRSLVRKYPDVKSLPIYQKNRTLLGGGPLTITKALQIITTLSKGNNGHGNLKQVYLLNAGETDERYEAIVETFKDPISLGIVDPFVNSSFIKDAYDVTQVLIYHYKNIVDKEEKSEDFCEIVRKYIAKEISKNSKVLKQIVYPEKLRDKGIFSIQEKFLEEKLNFVYKLGKEKEEDLAKKALKTFLKRAIPFEPSYFKDLDASLSERNNSLYLNVWSQFGRNQSFITTVERKKDTVKVEVKKAVLGTAVRPEEAEKYTFKEEEFAKEIYGKDAFTKVSSTLSSKYASASFEQYPYSSTRGFFKEGKDSKSYAFTSNFYDYTLDQDFKIGNITEKLSKTLSPASTGFVFKEAILQELKVYQQKLKRKNLSLVDNLDGKEDISVRKEPLFSKEYDIEHFNSGKFLKQYNKEYKEQNKEVSFETFFEICLKENVIKDIKEKLFFADQKNVLTYTLPVSKLLSYIAVNLNVYTDSTNSLFKEPSTAVNSYEEVNPMSLVEFKIKQREQPFNPLSGLDVQYIKDKDIGAQISALLFDEALFLTKNKLRQFMNFAETIVPNLSNSRAMADEISRAIKSAFRAVNKTEKLAQNIGRATTGNEIKDVVPTSGELISKNKAFKYLFDLPVTPFALANLAFFPLPPDPQQILYFVLYLVFEPILITLDLFEDDLRETLRKQLFEEAELSFVGASSKNFEKRCKDILEEYLLKNPKVSDGVTKGGEYIMPDGKEYKGGYHIHKDGTVMVGKDHKEAEENIVLTEIINRDDL